jgi:N utilization substance protein B
MGTRRKARECSLQIMFAADFSHFSDVEKLVADYWREFGFDEVSRGCSQQVRNFLQEIENLEIINQELKNIAKKTSQIKVSSRALEKYEELIWAAKRISESFINMIKKAIRADSGWLEEKQKVESAASSYRNLSKKFLKDLKYWMQTAERYYLMTEFESVNEVEEQTEHVLNKLDEILSNVCETIDEVIKVREFADRLVFGTVRMKERIDEMISLKAEHWRLPRMAMVDRNVLRLAVYEFLEEETPKTVVISEALETARRFSGYEAAQFVNGLLDAIKNELERQSSPVEIPSEKEDEETSQKMHQNS